jgi:preprotein translocase subunit SecY
MYAIYNKIKTIFAIEELRGKILNTFWFLFIFRVGSFVVLPGVDSSKLKGYRDGLLGILDTFLGGAFSNASIFGLGIMPYISASIAVQLLCVVLPSFQRMQMDGFAGRKKINKITKFLTLAVGLIQSTGYLAGTISNDMLLIDRTFFTISSLIFLISGTMFCVWLGDRITDKGIGNGTSMLISAGILSSLPGALFSEYTHRGGSNGFMILIFELVLLYFIVMAVVAFTKATRKVPIQYSKQMVGGTHFGQRQYIPFKLNMTGVMPIIFSQTLMFIPYLIFSSLAKKSDFAASISRYFSDFTSWQYNLVFGCLIILFTFFYTAITVNPENMASDMKKNNSFIPGVLSGKQTADYLDGILSKLTLPGAVFLAIIAVFPLFAKLVGMSNSFSRFYGGTSLLILVGVVCDLLQQVESFFLLNKYSSMSSTNMSKIMPNKN